MRLLLLFVALVATVGCATAYKTNALAPGMDKNRVLEIMGPPTSTSAVSGGVEVLNYRLYEENASIIYAFQRVAKPYFVTLQDGHVIAYGRLPSRETLRQAPSAGGPQILRENAYGPGIHMDQYGRPVRVTPDL